MGNEITVQIGGTDVVIVKEPTDIPGLLFRPRFRDYDNSADWLPFTRPASQEVSDLNFNVVANIGPFLCGPILEIGVSRNGDKSFTQALLKSGVRPYLGVDIENKSHLDDDSNRVYTYRCSSFDQNKVRKRMIECGMNTLGLILIDGWHSLDAVVNDWKYTDMLLRHGYVVLHDTNSHPPAAFIHAIDKKQYAINQMFQGQNDYGLTICQKL